MIVQARQLLSLFESIVMKRLAFEPALVSIIPPWPALWRLTVSVSNSSYQTRTELESNRRFLDFEKVSGPISFCEIVI